MRMGLIGVIIKKRVIFLTFVALKAFESAGAW